MKFSDLLDATTAGALNVAWLHAALEPAGEAGRRAAESIAPFRPGEETQARERAQTIVALAQRIERQHVDAMRDALRTAPDPISAISRAGMGGILSDANLLELLRFLDAVGRIDALLEASDAPMRYANESTRAVAHALEAGRAGKFGFFLSEKFDAQLAAARTNAESAQAQFESLRGRLTARVAADLGRDEISGNEFIVMRDTVRTLPRGVRVVREAPTYFLCELELDDAALEAMRKRDAAADAVAAAEEAVRERISAFVRERAQALDDLVRAAGELDVLLAAVRFAQEYSCVAADVVPEQTLAFELARYLPLQAELEAQGQRYEPISIDLSRTAILTGPNMGGKSVALRTCGFIAMLAAFGLPVPALSARCSVFEEIAWLGIGGREESGGLLSSFALEVVRLKDLLARPAAPSLLLIDEFARTTTPAEGRALLVALVRGLQRRGRLAFIATHLAGIAGQGGVRHFAVRGLRAVPSVPSGADLHAVLAALSQAMDYAVIPVSETGTPQADAIALAHLLGLDDDVVAEAGTVLSTEGA